MRGEDDHQVGPGDDERGREGERGKRRRSGSRRGTHFEGPPSERGEGGMDAHGDRLRTASCLGLGRSGILVWFGWVL